MYHRISSEIERPTLRAAAISQAADGPRADVRALLAASLTLLFVPLIIEALAIDPVGLSAFREPVTVALRLDLLDSLPYLSLALSVAVLAVVLRRRAPLDAPLRFSPMLALLAALLAITAAFATRSLPERLLAGDVAVNHGYAVLGEGGALAPHMSLDPVALERAGSLLDLGTPPYAGPRTVRVTWIGVRDAIPSAPGLHVELVGGDQVVDLTDDFASLGSGEARVFTRNVRVGPQAASIRMRLAQDPTPPINFFNARYEAEARGIAIDVGGDDRAYRNELPAGPDNPEGARFDISGEHGRTGYSVIVLSGEDWRSHDLGELMTKGGRLALSFAAVDAAAWSVRLVGDGVQSDPLPLASFARDTAGRRTTYSVALGSFALKNVPLAAVVGIALTYTGPRGPFDIQLLEATAALPNIPVTGFALATMGSLDPGVRPAQAWFAAGPAPATAFWRKHLFACRLVAGLLAVVAIVGARATWRLLVTQPATTALSILSGSLASALLPSLLLLAATPRLEQLPITLMLLTFVAAGWSRLRPQAAPVTAPSVAPRKILWLEALKGFGILGVIAIHVSADPAGLPYAGYTAAQRVFPAVARAVATELNYPLFIIASLFLVAHTLETRSTDYRSLVANRARRLIPPFLVWTGIYLVFRFVKADAFGYLEAYRHELSRGASWLNYLLLGGGQYHLHFLPLLMGLVLFTPLFVPARRRPSLALLLIATLALWPLADGFVFEHVSSPDWRNYSLRLTKTCAYIGYGLFAFALYGLWRDDRLRSWRPWFPGVAIAIALISLAALVHAGLAVAAAGQWLPNGPVAHMARYLAPPAVFAVILSLEDVRWPQWLVQLGMLSFGIYLLHPVILDLVEILEQGTGLAPIWLVIVNFLAALLLSTIAVRALSRGRAGRWLIGVT